MAGSLWNEMDFAYCVEDGLAACDSGIVDQDCGSTNFGADACGYFMDGSWGCDVAFVVVYAGC